MVTYTLPLNSAINGYAIEEAFDLYLCASVHRRCQRPQKGLGTTTNSNNGYLERLTPHRPLAFAYSLNVDVSMIQCMEQTHARAQESWRLES